MGYEVVAWVPGKARAGLFNTSEALTSNIDEEQMRARTVTFTREVNLE